MMEKPTHKIDSIEELNSRIELAATALKAAGAGEVYLFGSVGDNRYSVHSDVDLAVAGLPPERFFRAMGEARGILGRVLDLVDLDEPSPFVNYLKERGGMRRVAALG
jgi:predicted nucleotidyltransferase